MGHRRGIVDDEKRKIVINMIESKNSHLPHLRTFVSTDGPGYKLSLICSSELAFLGPLLERFTIIFEFLTQNHHLNISSTYNKGKLNDDFYNADIGIRPVFECSNSCCPKPWLNLKNGSK